MSRNIIIAEKQIKEPEAHFLVIELKLLSVVEGPSGSPS